MPSIRYYNQTAPFWDFIANLESAGLDHPFFGNQGGPAEPRAEGPTRGNPQAENPEEESSSSNEKPKEEDASADQTHNPENAHQSHGPAPPPYGHHPHHGHPPCGAPPHHGPPPPFGPGGLPFHGRRGGPHPCGGPNKFRRWGGGGCGHRGRGDRSSPPFGGWGSGDFDMSKIGEFFAAHLGSSFGAGEDKAGQPSAEQKDFSPPADIFDTEDAYIVHVSLSGAKKEDVGVNWDSDKSELSIAGVIHRPGDEEFLKTLALDERTVGAFERKVRLGSRANPAQIDVDAIAARMEDGVLIVTIPKLDREYVEVKKVDIE